jgi:CelD/BcsL family acetyltransferase involved in cellulose biosynthesis
VITVHRGDELVALAPLLAVGVGVGPAAVRLLVGAGQENADYGGALVVAGDEEARHALARHLVEEVGTGRTVLNLTRLPLDSPLLAAVRAALDPGRHELRCEAEEAYPRLDLRATDDPERAVARLLKANDVPRRLRRLGETGAVRWVAHHPDAAGEGLATFLRLHDLRWAGRHPSGPFASPAGRRFLAQAAAGLDRQGLLRLSLLLVDDVAVAARFGTVFDGWYLGMKSAWDPSYARFGPGHLVMGQLVRDALDGGLAGIDLLRGQGAHKLAWANGERRVGYWTVARGGRQGAADRLAARVLLRSRYRWRGSGSA